MIQGFITRVFSQHSSNDLLSTSYDNRSYHYSLGDYEDEEHGISSLLRYLQDGDESSSTTTNSTGTHQTDGEILKTTFSLYGTTLLVCFIFFCWVRQKFPRPYTIRNWVKRIQTPIAADQFGFFSWIWEMNAFTDDEILEECGMDSLCYLRLLKMGYQISCVCALNAIWLMPLYKYAEAGTDNEAVTDTIQQLTIANVPAGSPRLIGTVIAAYMLFGFVMHLILLEFTWFIEFRHKYLKKPKPRNYSIFVRNIPPAYRSNSGLESFFKKCYSAEHVLEAKLRVKTTKLAKEVQARDSILRKLEHAIAYEDLLGKQLLIRKKYMEREKFRAVTLYARQLHEKNEDISKRINAIEEKAFRIVDAADIEKPNKANVNVPNDVSNLQVEGDFFSSERIDNMVDSSTTRCEEGSNMQLNTNSTTNDVVNTSIENVTASGARLVPTSAVNMATSAISLIKGSEEGEYYDSGFVSFANLGTANAALQMIHHETPFEFEVHHAPDPEDIFWNNVGRPHKDIQVGRLISMAGTVALCIFWTFPMSFIASLSSIKGLKDVEFIGNLIENMPILEPILVQLAPLLVIVVNSLLPVILKFLAMREGPVSTSVVEASLFTKLAAFSIIQTFFVSFLGGGLLAEITEMLKDWTLIVDLLATSLPTKSTYFIQIVFVSNAITVILEILRVVPLVLAFIRRFLPPNLTEKERRKPVFIFAPLGEPGAFGQADCLSFVVLNFMVMLVYATIAPLTAFILGFCFAFMHICYRHQFVFIYPTLPDSGGKIWTDFIKILMICMLVSQVTIIGLMGLKKAAIATPLMFPLLVITFLFNAYVRQQHFRSAEYLPSRQCLKVDLANGPNFSLSFVEGVYLQEELRTKVKMPDITPIQSIMLEQHDILVHQEPGSDSGSTLEQVSGM